MEVLEGVLFEKAFLNAISIWTFIKNLYPIIAVGQKRRADLTIEQTGTNKIREPDKVYWLFTLGAALKLKSSVIKNGVRGRFEVKLTSAAALSEVKNWSDLPQRYQFL